MFNANTIAKSAATVFAFGRFRGGLRSFLRVFRFQRFGRFGSGVLWRKIASSSFQWCFDGVLSCLWSSVVFARIGVVALLFRGIVRACSACYAFASRSGVLYG